MDYKSVNLKNYDLHMVKTNRFKQIKLLVDLRIKDEKENSKYLKILQNILLKTSPNYQTIKEINTACASIYDPCYYISYIESGKEGVFTLDISFINEKYTEKGMNKKSIDFVLDFLFNPKIINNGFDKEIFELEKKSFISSLKSVKDNPQRYAKIRLDEEMDTKDYKEYKIEELIEDVQKTNEKELYNFYQKLMKNSKLDIFVIGDIEFNEIEKIISEKINFNGKHQGKINHLIKQTNIRRNPRVIIEKVNNTQSILNIGCKIESLTDIERKYVFPLYSWILGGCMNSLLNQTVREKNSLCYYIYTSRQNLLETMSIHAGIDGENFKKTINLIDEEMHNMEKGNFEEELLESVRNIYLNSLKSIEDSIGTVIGNFECQTFKTADSINQRKEEIMKVTKEDITKFSKKVHIDTIFLLKGENNGKKWSKKFKYWYI